MALFLVICLILGISHSIGTPAEDSNPFFKSISVVCNNSINLSSDEKGTFKSCKSYEEITNLTSSISNSNVSLTDSNAKDVLCLLYFKSVTLYCKNESKYPNLKEIKDKYNISSVCGNLTEYYNSIFINNTMKQNICYHLCTGFMVNIKPECLYFQYYNMENLKQAASNITSNSSETNTANLHTDTIPKLTNQTPSGTTQDSNETSKNEVDNTMENINQKLETSGTSRLVQPSAQESLPSPKNSLPQEGKPDNSMTLNADVDLKSKPQEQLDSDDENGNHGISNENPDYTDDVESPAMEQTITKVSNDKKPEIVQDNPINNDNIGDIDGESYFFSYFMVMCVLFVLGYVAYHNRIKVMALLLEGKKNKRQQRNKRPNSANYHKLDSNLEEAISSNVTKNSNNVIY